MDWVPLKREMVRGLGVKKGKRGNEEVEMGCVSMGEAEWGATEWRKKWRTCCTISGCRNEGNEKEMSDSMGYKTIKRFNDSFLIHF